MKRWFIVSLLLLVSITALAILQTQTVRSLERLGIAGDALQSAVWYSISGGYLSTPNTTKLKQIAMGDRAGVVREIATFAKAYTQSAEFKQKYREYRDGQKPTPPEKPKSMAEQRQEQKANMQKGIREMEASLKSVPRDQQDVFKQSIQMMKDQLKELDNPNNPMFSPQMEEYAKQAYDMQMDEYKTKLAEWEQEYPTSPTPMIRKWLTNFLEVSKDVDFRAALKDGQYGKRVFVNPEYEAKPSNWKMCYRAGKEVVEAGRAEAQKWLNELK